MTDVLLDRFLEAHGTGGADSDTGKPAAPTLAVRCLTVADWLGRELAEPNWLLGRWLSTTSRVMLYSDTGIGKTSIALAMANAVAAGDNFLHWHGSGAPHKVLIVDGEMPIRLLRGRLSSEIGRSGRQGEGLHALSHEDIADFAPLNDEAGRKFIDDLIAELGGIDLIVFDNIMSLIAGDQKDEESWRAVLPWFRSLTKRNIGQLWVHHTGHDDSHSYGTKVREWQMCTVLKLARIDEPDSADVSFVLTFQKARERTPETRDDFRDVKIALCGDMWVSEPVDAGGARKNGKHQREAPSRQEFTDSFTEALDSCGIARRVRGSGPAVRAVRVGDVHQEFCRRHATGEDDKKKRKDAQRHAFKRMLDRAKEKRNGFATETDGDTEWIWNLK